MRRDILLNLSQQHRLKNTFLMYRLSLFKRRACIYAWGSHLAATYSFDMDETARVQQGVCGSVRADFTERNCAWRIESDSSCSVSQMHAVSKNVSFFPRVCVAEANYTWAVYTLYI